MSALSHNAAASNTSAAPPPLLRRSSSKCMEWLHSGYTALPEVEQQWIESVFSDQVLIDDSKLYHSDLTNDLNNRIYWDSSDSDSSAPSTPVMQRADRGSRRHNTQNVLETLTFPKRTTATTTNNKHMHDILCISTRSSSEQELQSPEPRWSLR